MQDNPNDLASASIRITYEGAALESHSIDVEAFGRSIMAASHILKETSRVLYGFEFIVRLELKAVEANCISADLLVYVSRAADAIHFLANNPVTAFLDDILKLAGYAAPLGFYAFFRWLRNRKISKTEKHEETITLYLEDGTQETISLKLYEAICNSVLRKYIKQHTQILQTPGIERIRYFRKGDEGLQEATILTKDDLRFFDLDLDLDEAPIEREFDVIAELDRPSFHKSKRGWKLVWEGKVVPVALTITDDAFLEDVASGKIFVAKGQKFHIHLIEERKPNQTKPKYKATIIMPRPLT